MKCENCGGYDVSISPGTPGGLWVILSLACTVAVLVVLIVQKLLISAEAPFVVIRILRYLRVILSIAGIATGAVALVKKNLLGIAGIVVALLGEEATVKRLYRQNGEVWLMPENDAYAPISGVGAQILEHGAQALARADHDHAVLLFRLGDLVVLLGFGENLMGFKQPDIFFVCIARQGVDSRVEPAEPTFFGFF